MAGLIEVRNIFSISIYTRHTTNTTMRAHIAFISDKRMALQQVLLMCLAILYSLYIYVLNGSLATLLLICYGQLNKNACLAADYTQNTTLFDNNKLHVGCEKVLEEYIFTLAVSFCQRSSRNQSRNQLNWSSTILKINLQAQFCKL